MNTSRTPLAATSKLVASGRGTFRADFKTGAIPETRLLTGLLTELLETQVCSNDPDGQLRTTTPGEGSLCAWRDTQ